MEQQSGPSFNPSQPAGSQLPPSTQPEAPTQQYGTPPTTGAAMLPPQRPSQSTAHQLNSSHSSPTTTSLPQGHQSARPPSSQAPSMTAAVTAAPSQSTPAPNSPVPEQSASPRAGNLPPREQEQVAALLNINSLILREVQKLQSAGAASQPPQASPQQQHAPLNQQSNHDPTREAQNSPTGTGQTPTSTTPTPHTPKSTKPNPKQLYDNYMKRIQLTIAYLLALAQGKQTPPYPVIMEPPPVAWFIPGPGEDAPEDAEQKGREAHNDVTEGYKRLKDLWPNYPGAAKHAQQMRMQQQQQQQQQQAQQAAQARASLGQSIPSGTAQAQALPQQRLQGIQEQQTSQMMSPPAQPGPGSEPTS